MQKDRSNHIMIVDDEYALLRSLSVFMRSEGWTVSVAHDGNEAVNAMVSCSIGPKPVDIMLFDISMPSLSGLQILEELETRRIRVSLVAMTGLTDAKTLCAIQQRGCLHIIAKPFKLNELLKILQLAMEEGV